MIKIYSMIPTKLRFEIKNSSIERDYFMIPTKLRFENQKQVFRFYKGDYFMIPQSSALKILQTKKRSSELGV
jgi:hypothetical protein